MERLFENLGSLKQQKFPRGFPPAPHKGVYNAVTEPTAAWASAPTHVGLWCLAIKLNPS